MTAAPLALPPAAPSDPPLPMLLGKPDDASLIDRVLSPPWTRSRSWWILVGISAAGTAVFICGFAYSVVLGPGVWGNNIPVAWAYPIVNFVWWIGIGHAGTFISAFLLLLAQRWRASINRVAEAMTLFALVNAGLFPLLHLGRPWFAYWLIPYPATMGVWPQFKSTLPWDVVAVTTYFLVSLLFWYVGLIPDLAAARSRARTRFARVMYGIFALGWRGSAREWHEHASAYTLLAALATPLVISVHSIVSLDFAIAQLPGWHSSIFPPYFVVGAVFSGFAMVLVLLLPVRRVMHLRDLITERHLDALAKLMLAMSLMLAYSYLVESFVAWYNGAEFERFLVLVSRPTGRLGWIYWAMLAGNVALPQALWFRRVRRSPMVLFGISLVIVAAMWAERFVIVVGSLSRDFLPSSWADYIPTWVDWSILFGSVGLFSLLFLLFLRVIPVVPAYEVRGLRDELARSAGAGSHA